MTTSAGLAEQAVQAGPDHGPGDAPFAIEQLFATWLRPNFTQISSHFSRILRNLEGNASRNFREIWAQPDPTRPETRPDLSAMRPKCAVY